MTSKANLSLSEPRAWFESEKRHSLSLSLNTVRLSILPILIGLTAILPLCFIPMTSMLWWAAFLAVSLVLSVVNSGSALMREDSLSYFPCTLSQKCDERMQKNNKTQGAECINRNSTLISYVYSDGPRPTKKTR